MLWHLITWLRTRGDAAQTAPVLPHFERAEVEHLWQTRDGFPCVDWHMVDRWISNQRSLKWTRGQLRRVVMGQCLDEIRDSLDVEHRRWRSANVEGLAPVEGTIAQALARTAESAYKILTRDLAVIRGDQPISPVALVAIEPRSSYFDFTSSYFPEGGEFASSGGMYLHGGSNGFSMLAVNCAPRHGAETAVAHELTHHALHDCALPLWMEEGFTQMMEERVVGGSNFTLNREFQDRHAALWNSRNIKRFIEGEMFISPVDDQQELAYHLSQWLVRSELTRRPKEFFAFARACREMEADQACLHTLGVTQQELIAELFRPRHGLRLVGGG
jgi:hypothetical protein